MPHSRLSGTLRGKFDRKQTGTCDWAEAKALVAFRERADSWDGKISPPPPPVSTAIPDVADLQIRKIRSRLAAVAEWTSVDVGD